MKPWTYRSILWTDGAWHPQNPRSHESFRFHQYNSTEGACFLTRRSQTEYTIPYCGSSPCLRSLLPTEWVSPSNRLHSKGVWVSWSPGIWYEMEPPLLWKVFPCSPTALCSSCCWRYCWPWCSCGHYQSCTSTVAQLCRSCVCPTEKSGYSKARAYAKCTPHSVNQMVANRQF